MRLVTLIGGAGYIGQRLARYLTDLGWDVHISDPCVVDPAAPERLGKSVTWCSLLNDGPIVYLASLHDFPGWDTLSTAQRFEWQQVGRKLMIDEPVRLARSGRPLVYISSMRALTHPNTFYGNLKKQAERLLFQLPNVSILRFGTVMSGLSSELYNRTITVPNNWIMRGELPDENWKAYVTHMDKTLHAIWSALPPSSTPGGSVRNVTESMYPWDAERLSHYRPSTHGLDAEREPHPAIATAKHYNLPLPKGLA